MYRFRTATFGLVCALVVVMGVAALAVDLLDKDPSVREQVIEHIKDDYWKSVPTDRFEGKSPKQIVRSLHDRFSAYYTPKEAKEFSQALSSQFEGIGVSVQPVKRGLQVVTVFDGSPAKRAGIHPSDVIVGVNGKSIAGVPSDVATTRIKGPAGTSVRLSVQSEGAKPREVSVKRAKIDVPIAIGKMLDRDGTKLAYVRLAAFNEGAHAAVRDKLAPLLRRGARGIVLDLRANGGGLLEEAVLVSSLFIEDGPIVSTKGRRRAERKFSAEGDALAPKLPMVVLVDGGSASASEIVTGALRDRGRATVVGEKTFGKGVFQEVETLTDGSKLELIVGSYYLPNGENIAQKGILPKVRAKDLPKTRPDEALPIAEDVLVATVR